MSTRTPNKALTAGFGFALIAAAGAAILAGLSYARRQSAATGAPAPAMPGE